LRPQRRTRKALILLPSLLAALFFSPPLFCYIPSLISEGKDKNQMGNKDKKNRTREGGGEDARKLLTEREEDREKGTKRKGRERKLDRERTKKEGKGRKGETLQPAQNRRQTMIQPPINESIHLSIHPCKHACMHAGRQSSKREGIDVFLTHARKRTHPHLRLSPTIVSFFL